MSEAPTDAELTAILSSVHHIAVLGASATAWRAGHYVGEYLAKVGYEVTGINPALEGETLWGRPVAPTLARVVSPIDLVDVFRRSEELPAHLPELLSLSPRPQCVWFQLGVRNDEVASALRAEGIRVVQDRCTLADHRRLEIPPR